MVNSEVSRPVGLSLYDMFCCWIIEPWRWLTGAISSLHLRDQVHSLYVRVPMTTIGKIVILIAQG